MGAYQKERIENAICFFAKEHYKNTKKRLPQTFLYKYLAFLDFQTLKETGKPALGLVYKAMPKGPVPEEIYSKKSNTELYEFKQLNPNDLNQYSVIHKKEPDLDYFSKYEIKKMNEIIEFYATSYTNTKIISDVSHEIILAWKKTFEKQPKEPYKFIDYALELTDDVPMYVKDSFSIWDTIQSI